MMRRFTAKCKQYCITLNEEEDQSVFLGMQWDCLRRTVKLAEKTVNKLPGYVWKTTTLEQVEQLMGRLFYCAEVLDIQLKFFYNAIKFYRKVSWRLSRGENPQTPVEWWAAAHVEVNLWNATARENTTRDLSLHKRPSNCAPVCFTDASQTGFGIVLIDGGRYFEYAGSWRNYRWWRNPEWVPHINQLELWVVTRALDWIQSLGYDHQDTELKVDNKTAIAVIRDRRSRSFWLNRLIAEVGEMRWKSVQYVNTLANLADGLSRGKHSTKTTTASPHGAGE